MSAKIRYIESHKELVLAKHVAKAKKIKGTGQMQNKYLVAYAGGAKKRQCLGVLENGRQCEVSFYSLGSHHRFCNRCSPSLNHKGRMAEWCVELPETIRSR